jgi:diacylglycerol kinase (ATP)
MRAAIVYNPAKRGVEAVKRRVAVVEKQLGFEPSLWFETSARDGGVSAARKALAKAPDVIIAVGGDGTVRAVIEALRGAQGAAESDIPVGIIARGTGNILARNLGLPVSDLRRMVRIAFCGKVTHIDVPTIVVDGPRGPSTSVFMVMAGLGIDAEMAAFTNAKLKRSIGWLAYIGPILRATFRGKRSEVTVVLESGEHDRRRQHTAIIGNCGVLQGGLQLMPRARLDDGLLDVLALDPTTPWGWMRIARRIAIGSALRRAPGGLSAADHLPAVGSMRYRQASRIEWRMDSPMPLQIDGDPLGEVSRVVVTVSPRALGVHTG